MKPILALALGLIALLPAASNAAPASLAVDGGAVAIPAPAAGGVMVFKGLAYAAAPVGAARWRPPGPVSRWSGVRPTDHFGPDCMQKVSSASPAARSRSEDCLYLNVWSTSLQADRRPVFVWIHGGGSRVGSGAQPQFDGSALARKGLVVVTINYRLGPFGFLSSPALSGESGYRASGNYGFMDQIAALKWVKRNIAKFGGDPRRVTIGGESSGSVSAGALMASPMAAGLFRGAIGESGSIFRVAEFGSMGAAALAAEEQKGRRLEDALHVRDADALRRVPADDILAAADRLGTYYNLPVVDGYVLPASPSRIFERSRQNDVALLVGWNSDEGSLPGMGGLGPVPELLAKYYRSEAAKIAPFYSTAKPDDIDTQIQVTGDNQIAFSAWKWAMDQRRFGSKPVYLYAFDRAPPVPPGEFGAAFDASHAGAFHGAEISYVFGTLAAKSTWALTDEDRRISDMMSSYWANFVKTGNPNGAGLPPWPAYDPDGTPRRLQIGTDTRAVADPDYTKFIAILAAHRQIDPPEPIAPVLH